MSVNNFRAIFTLIVFLIAEVLVSFPVYIAIPRRIFNLFRLFVPSNKLFGGESASNGNATVEPTQASGKSDIGLKQPANDVLRGICIPLNYVTAPVAAVLLLLAVGSIHGEQISKGTVGSDGVEPLNVMALFICLAYMVLSVDRAGVLRFLAFWVASRGGSSGIRLFIAIYAFFFCVGTVIGNDPVILSGVPFLAYFTRETGIDPPTAWIFCQFINANIASTVLVSSNPTNLVLSGAFSISYFVYTAKVILPVLAATFATLPVLLAMFRNPRYIPRKMRPITLNPRSALVDPVGGVFSSAVLILTLGTLVATSTLHPPLYLVTLPPAILVLIRDILYDLRNCRSKKLKLGETPTGPKADAPLVLDAADMDSKEKTQNIEVQEEHGDETLVGMGHNGEGVPPTRPTEQESANLSTKEQSIPQRDGVETLRVSDTGATAEGLHLPISKARETPGVSDTGATEEGLPLPLSKAHETPISFLQRTFPTVTAIFKIMPFSLVIFSLSLFILVQGLAVTGWVDIWAQWWGAWTEKTGLVGTVFGMGLTSCILCNLFGTNIGATILLARVLQVWIQNSSQTPSSRVQDGAIYTLALGSNYGAFTFSFPASLAGLLWRKLLLSKGIKVKMSQFALLNLLPCAIAMATSCSVLLGEIYITHR